MTKIINLYRPIRGKCINVKDFGPARISSVDTTDLGCFPGGTGIYEVVVERIPDDILQLVNAGSGNLTELQLRQCESIIDSMTPE